ncbi:MAG: hypothetical protein QXH30_01435 [Candidatus Bilamarchaeaceae archaeon]
MRLFAEALVSALIALFVLNFLGIGLDTLTSVTSFFVIMLFMILIEEKTGIANKNVIKMMRLEQPLLTTTISFGVLLVLSLVFSTIYSKISGIVSPLVGSFGSTLGLIGLGITLAMAYRLFYHFMYREIEVGGIGGQLAKKIIGRR